MSIDEDLSYSHHRADQERRASASASNPAAADIHSVMAETYQQQADRLSSKLRLVGADTAVF